MDAISQTRLGGGHPVLADRIYMLEKKVPQFPFRVTRVWASYNQQMAYWAQGRQSLIEVNALRLKVGLAAITDKENSETVTDAQPGWTAHSFGYAADIVPADPAFPKFTPDYNVLHDDWKAILAAALTTGLAEGAQWTMKHRDYPHLYLQELPATPDDEFRTVQASGGIMAVFALIDKRLKRQ